MSRAIKNRIGYCPHSIRIQTPDEKVRMCRCICVLYMSILNEDKDIYYARPFIRAMQHIQAGIHGHIPEHTREPEQSTLQSSICLQYKLMEAVDIR